MSHYSDYKSTGRATCRRCGIHERWYVSGTRAQCKDCAKRNPKNPDTASRYKTTVPGAVATLIHQAQAKARVTGMPVDVDREWVLQKYEEQDGRCAYTGWPFVLEFSARGVRRPRAMSLDQVVPGEGYTKENVALVCWTVNEAKRDMTLEAFRDMCAAVSSAAPPE